MHNPVLALAFSGGLDTSYCVPRLAERGYRVHTVYVNTGGATAAERSGNQLTSRVATDSQRAKQRQSNSSAARS